MDKLTLEHAQFVIEGAYRTLEQSVVEPVITEAAMRGAIVAFKDSLIVSRRLIAFG